MPGRGVLVGSLIMCALSLSSGFQLGSLPMRYSAKKMSTSALLSRNHVRAGPTMISIVEDNKPEDRIRVGALVVGGGPAGLGAATMLAKKGWKDVTVVERRDTAGAFERQLAYVYNIDGRGRNFTDAIGITKDVKAHGVSASNFTFTRIMPDKRGATPPVVPYTYMPQTSVWITRSELLDVMSKAALKAGVKILYGCRVEELKQEEDGLIVRCASNEAEDHFTFKPKLIVGCDGIASRVRESMYHFTGDDGYVPRHLNSPAGGLRYKMLVIPNDMEVKNLSVPEGAARLIRTRPEASYTIVSKFKSRYTTLRLGLLPNTGQIGHPRTANIIQPAKHKIWKMRTGEELLEYLEDSFPQIEVRKYISPDQAENFVHSKGGVFPHPQYLPKIQGMFNSTAVVLMGDAIHAFPPDLGQGVNAALEDVSDFTTCLAKFGGGPDTDMAPVLQEYQNVRAPEAKAIAKLVQIGFPYQYSQSVWRVKLFMANFVLRKVLNTLAKFVGLGRVFCPPVVTIMPGARYTQAWQRAQRTTYALIVLTVAFVARFALKSGVLPYLQKFGLIFGGGVMPI